MIGDSPLCSILSGLMNDLSRLLGCYYVLSAVAGEFGDLCVVGSSGSRLDLEPDSMSMCRSFMDRSMAEVCA